MKITTKFFEIVAKRNFNERHQQSQNKLASTGLQEYIIRQTLHTVFSEIFTLKSTVLKLKDQIFHFPFK